MNNHDHNKIRYSFREREDEQEIDECPSWIERSTSNGPDGIVITHPMGSCNK